MELVGMCSALVESSSLEVGEAPPAHGTSGGAVFLPGYASLCHLGCRSAEIRIYLDKLAISTARVVTVRFRSCLYFDVRGVAGHNS